MTVRQLARGSILITLANIAPRAGAFLLLPVYTRFLTTADFGLVSLASSAALLLAMTCRLGLDAAALRMHHELSTVDRRAMYTTVVVMSSLAALSVAALGVVAGLAFVGRDLMAGVATAGALALAIGALNTLQFLPSTWFRATDQTGRYLGVALAAFGAVVVVTLALVVVVPLGAVGSLTGQLAGAVVAAGAAAVILWRQRPWTLRWDLGREALAFGLPLLPHSMAGWVLNVSDRWLLGLLLGVAAVDAIGFIGVYSLGYQLGYAVGLVAISFNAAWLPFLYRLGRSERASAVLRESTTLAVAGFAALAAALAILAPELVAWLAPPAWSQAADVAAVVAMASALNAAGLMVASGIYLDRRTRLVPVLTMAAAAANVGANVILIPLLGIMGAAWATLIAYGVLLVGFGFVVLRRERARVDVLRTAAIGAVAGGVTLVSRNQDVSGLVPHLMMSAVVVVTIGIIASGAVRRLSVALRIEWGSGAGLG